MTSTLSERPAIRAAVMIFDHDAAICLSGDEVADLDEADGNVDFRAVRENGALTLHGDGFHLRIDAGSELDLRLSDRIAILFAGDEGVRDPHLKARITWH